jgi:hypothetical protein
MNVSETNCGGYSGIIFYSYFTSNVLGNPSIGGLFGFNDRGFINCYFWDI